MTNPRTHFTVEEATRRLPLVKSIVMDIMELYGDVTCRRERLEDVRRVSQRKPGRENTIYDEELEQMEQELERDSSRLHTLISELEDIGAELEDPAAGQVDFLSRLDNRDVYLCWQIGEPDITHWHELDGVFEDRHSLLEGTVASPGSEGGDNGES